MAGMHGIHGLMAVARRGSSLCLLMLKLAGCHLRRHRVAHPAAQGQQGNQQGEEQVAHG